MRLIVIGRVCSMRNVLVSCNCFCCVRFVFVSRRKFSISGWSCYVWCYVWCYWCFGGVMWIKE